MQDVLSFLPVYNSHVSALQLHYNYIMLLRNRTELLIVITFCPVLMIVEKSAILKQEKYVIKFKSYFNKFIHLVFNSDKVI